MFRRLTSIERREARREIFTSFPYKWLSSFSPLLASCRAILTLFASQHILLRFDLTPSLISLLLCLFLMIHSVHFLKCVVKSKRAILWRVRPSRERERKMHQPLVIFVRRWINTSSLPSSSTSRSILWIFDGTINFLSSSLSLFLSYFLSTSPSLSVILAHLIFTIFPSLSILNGRGKYITLPKDL